VFGLTSVIQIPKHRRLRIMRYELTNYGWAASLTSRAVLPGKRPSCSQWD
jgi:hypothetical protein